MDSAGDISVRLARSSDVPALTEMRMLMDREDGVEAPPEFAETFGSWFAVDGPKFQVYVAQRLGVLAGTVWLERVARVPRPNEPAAPPLGYMTNIYVLPEHRNCGVGAALLRRALSDARRDRFATVAVWPSERSRPLYEREGFAASECMQIDL